jgi:hypothetical protein
MGMTGTGRGLSRSDLLRQCAGAILLVGLCAAAYLYATSTDAPAEGIGYVTEGGESFQVLPTDSRSYQRNLEYYGGKSAVLMLELRQWWAGLWRGSTLALVVACAALLAAGCCLYAARFLEEDPEDEATSDATDRSGGEEP